MTEPEIKLFKVQWRMSHVALNEINKLSAANIGKRSLSEHEFSLVGSNILCYRIDQAFMDCQNGDLRNRDMLSLLCRAESLVERMSYHEMLAYFDDYNLNNVKV